MGRVILNRQRRKRLEQGHPWVYQSEVSHVEGDLVPGDIVDIFNHQGVFLARGYANPHSQILARVLTYRQEEAIDQNFVTRRVKEAFAWRQRFLQGTDSCRVVYGEADFLPGLVVDKYADVLVVQILSAGMERMKPWIREALRDVFTPSGILLRNDVPVRKLEHLPLETEVWHGEVPDEVEIVENGLTFRVDVREGQKTGYFFDQRENRRAIEPIARGARDVLDCFSHVGSFAIHAAHYGAQNVVAVDISESAMTAARRNAELNGLADKIQFEVANVFDYLRELGQAGREFDVVILDPPAFAKSKRALEGAVRGYKDINLRGMKLVREGGWLVTASCSYHMHPELFRETVLAAAFDAHKILRQVSFSGAGKDHPQIAGVEEGDYLKFAIYQVYSR